MPGYILHMLHGKMFLEKYCSDFSDNEIKQFIIGTIMPDSNKTVKADNDNSHFYSGDTKNKILKVPDINNFPYRFFIKNPFVLGYSAHLYLDKIFFEDYFPSCVVFLDKNGNKTELIKEAVNAKILKSNRIISIGELYSEDYLYGDYTMTNKYIAEKYYLQDIVETFIDNPIAEIDLNNLCNVKSAIYRFIEESSDKTEMKVFDIENLENAIERYAFGFSQWSEGVKSMIIQ
ncbi:MAG: hypothetical protein K2G36_02885 [Ruminococcus sp.]|nr:hypothetical protein [Ruminococcus sp.]